MTRLLLDHPWPLDAATDARSDGYQVLLKFVDLVRSSGLAPVPFIEPQDRSEAIQRLNYSHSGAAAICRFLPQIVRDAIGGALATPITEKPDPEPPFSVCWKQGLRDQLEDPANWRNPQIIVPRKRRTVWPDTPEVSIQCEDRPGIPPPNRVLAALDEYESHPFTVQDLDPWRHLEWLKRPQPGVRIAYPCRLPKPPILESVPVEQLFRWLGAARTVGWNVNGRYYFIPPTNCRPELVEKADWRKGSAFVLGRRHTQKGIKIGPIDCEGRIWAWDLAAERHWDVQLPDGKYMNISHDGRLL